MEEMKSVGTVGGARPFMLLSFHSLFRSHTRTPFPAQPFPNFVTVNSALWQLQLVSLSQ